MQALAELSNNVHLLLERYRALQEENAALRAKVEAQHQEIMQVHSDLVALQQQNRRLGTVNSMSSAESSEQALKRINALIAQVDRAIAALKR